MTPVERITAYVGNDQLEQAKEESRRRRISSALGVDLSSATQAGDFAHVWFALELSVFELLESEDRDALRDVALEAFQVGRSLDYPEESLRRIEFLLRLSCYGTLADRSSDVSRILAEERVEEQLLNSPDWGIRVQVSVYDIWFRLLRKSGWGDLDSVLERVAALRKDQAAGEPDFLERAAETQDQSPAWALMARYHLSKAAEIMSVFLCFGKVDEAFDVREQLQSQFDRALITAGKARDMELENMARLLARTAQVLVENSIWTVTRAVNSKVTKFVEQVTSRARSAPIFTVLPPQREVLLKEGLLGSSHRAVVVSLPTSSGKTFIAEFRILQALNQFENEKGWVAYLAPTRALVNQITLKLRRDFGPLGVNVEKVSPALEIDGLEAGMLTETGDGTQFRVLVTTPEKFDLMLRGGWEEKIGRPLTLVVVDEAHGLASENRGLKLELLLATINRECKYAQFLLLTPFIPNGGEIARWLSPDSNRSMDLSVEWSPNDRIIGIAHRRKTDGVRGGFHIELETIHTTRPGLTVSESIEFSKERPLGLSWSAAGGNGKLASATAHLLAGRGTTIILATKPKDTWGIASALKGSLGANAQPDEDLEYVVQYLAEELGQNFPLVSLVRSGIGVHHAGLSEDTRVLVEWLTERGSLHTLVATTTIAQGLNFPVSGVVFSSHQYPYGQDMPAEDFWNIAGRAGRVGQSDIGVIALVAPDEAKARTLRTYLQGAAGRLNSTLVEMVQSALQNGAIPELGTLSAQPQWSAFVQYLAHSYRQIGDHNRFASQIENVLRGTLGFQELRRTHQPLAVQLVDRVQNYAIKMRGQPGPLSLVDSTGFSLESVLGTLRRISEEKLNPDVWSTDLFGVSGQAHLRVMMGLLIQVPELKENLLEAGGTSGDPGDRLARIVTDWVQGKPLTEIAQSYFPVVSDSEDAMTKSMTSCCRMIYSKLAQTASWGLSALQSLTLGDSLEGQSEEVVRQIRNLPSWIYYGVNSDEAMAVRMLGVPRTAAAQMATKVDVQASDSISVVRQKLKQTDSEIWVSALGPKGATYHRVWQILEGEV